MYTRFLRYLTRPPTWRTLPEVIIALGIVAYLDALTGPDLSFSIFYLLPVAVATLRFGRSLGMRVGVTSAIIWTAIDSVSHGFHLLEVWNGAVRLGYFLIVSGLLAELASRFEAEAALAREDALTGLLNRRGFIEAAERELARSRRTGEAVAFAFLDLDDFKTINDTEGHEAGDAVLRDMAAVCLTTMRSVDLTSRMGGDEFAFCLPGVTREGAQRAVDRLRENATAQPHLPGFSLGLAYFEEPPLTLDAAMHEVDRAMYRAKAAGKGLTVVAAENETPHIHPVG